MSMEETSSAEQDYRTRQKEVESKNRKKKKYTLYLGNAG